SDDLFFRQLGHPQAITDVLFHREVRKQGIVLKDRVHTAAIWRQRIEPLTAHKDLTGIGALESADDAQQSGLSRSALAEDSEEFAFGNIERDVAQDRRGSERFRNFVDAEEGGDRSDCSWRDLGLSEAGHLVCTHEQRKGDALTATGEMPARYCAAFTSFQISLYLARRGTFCQK